MPRFVDFDLDGRVVRIEIDPDDTGVSGQGDFREWWGGVLQVAAAVVPEKDDESSSAPAVEVEIGVGAGPEGEVVLGAPDRMPIRIQVKPPTGMSVDEIAGQRPGG